MSRNEKRIRDAAAKRGIAFTSLRWEPVTAPMEMCGHGGGWLANDCEPLGLSTEEALDFIAEHGDHLLAKARR